MARQRSIINKCTARIGALLPAIFLCLLCAATFSCRAQVADGWYNTDSLLTRISKNKQLKQALHDAVVIYTHAGIDSSSISPQAFTIAYLEKWMADHGYFPVSPALYRKKDILSVVDYTKPGNKPRFITVDLKRQKILYDTLVTQGAGSGDRRNDKYCLPVYFSNELNSECSSPGLIAATRGTHPDNPCHLCRYTFSQPHDCVVVLEGLEKGINNNLLARDVVIHTTGSLSFRADSLRKWHSIKEPNYIIVPDSCRCYRTAGNGNVTSSSTYAASCGIAENGGYMGQSNGCLVLPEEHHIAMMQALKSGSLIFIYTNVILQGTNYFKTSPIIKKMVHMAGK